MNKIVQIVAPCIFCLSSSVALAAKIEDACPADLVNFWKNYVSSTENYAAIPVFLLKNECMRTLGSTDFHTAMVRRFDHPEVDKYVDDLYAQLDWGKTVITQ